MQIKSQNLCKSFEHILPKQPFELYGYQFLHKKYVEQFFYFEIKCNLNKKLLNSYKNLF